jgi:hypothetical protein
MDKTDRLIKDHKIAPRELCLKHLQKFLIIGTIFTITLLYYISTNNQNVFIYSMQPAQSKSSFIYSFISKSESIKLNESEIKGWTRDTNRNASDYVLPVEDTEVLITPNVCFLATDPLFILIIVSSTANNFKARQIIRKTWGNTTKFNYPLFQKMHGANTGNYLDINYENWRQYAVVSASYHFVFIFHQFNLFH